MDPGTCLGSPLGKKTDGEAVHTDVSCQPLVEDRRHARLNRDDLQQVHGLKANRPERPPTLSLLSGPTLRKTIKREMIRNLDIAELTS